MSEAKQYKQVTSLSIAPDLLARIDLAAQIAGVSRSQWVCDACEDMLEQHKEQREPVAIPTARYLAERHVAETADQRVEAKRIHYKTGVRCYFDENGVARDPFNGQPIEAK